MLGADERICALTRRLVHGEELRVSARPGGRGAGPDPPPPASPPPAPLPQFGAIHARCLLTPGHTSGHMSYFLWEEECPDPPAVFSGTGCPAPLPRPLRPRSSASDLPCPPGDALSVAGCGLRLESTALQMYESLTQILGTLPPETVRAASSPPLLSPPPGSGRGTRCG